MEDTVCLLCGQHDGPALMRRAEPRHVVCRRCGLVYQNPRPTSAEMLEYYRRGYWESSLAVNRDPIERRQKSAAKRGAAIAEWTAAVLQPSDLLVDIGAGRGEILNFVRSAIDCRVLGVEPSVEQSAAARERFGLTMISSDLDAVDLGQDKAKCVVLSHVLEHFHDPRTALRQCRELLCDGGWIFIEVPNILLPHPRKRLSNWLTIEHMYYFSLHTLTQVLEPLGFRVVRSQTSTFVRVLAEKTPPLQPSAGTSALASDYYKVWRALLRHECVYWPRRLSQRVARLWRGEEQRAAISQGDAVRAGAVGPQAKS